MTHKQSKTLPKLFLEKVFTVGLWIGHVIIDSAVWVSLKIYMWAIRMFPLDIRKSEKAIEKIFCFTIQLFVKEILISGDLYCTMWKQRRRGNLCWIKSCLGKERVAMITIWGCQFFNCLCFSVKIIRVACKHQANNGVSGLEVLWVCGLCWIFYSCKHGETRKLQPFVLFQTGSCLWK